MRSVLFKLMALTLLATLGLITTGCGSRAPRPEDTPGWNAVEAYAKAIKRETLNVVAIAKANPREASAQADAALENFNDQAKTGDYTETIAQIKEKLQAMAAGKGNAAGLKELADKLPGDAPTAGKK